MAPLTPCPLGWDSTPDPVLPQCQVPNGLTSQYTKLKTNQGIILVNISIFEVTDTFLSFFKSKTGNKIEIMKPVHSMKCPQSKQDAEGLQNMSGVYLIVIFL